MTASRRLPWKSALLWALLAFILAAGHAALTYRNISPSNDLWDYSQEARQLARGEGFTSLYTYPTLLRAEEQPPFPVRWRMPFYSWRASLMLKSGVPLPAGYFAIYVLSQAMVAFFVFLLGTHFHSRRAGHIAAAAAVACPLLLDSYHPGLSQLPVAALGLLVWLLLLRERGIPSAAAAGGVAALIWYIRAEAALFLPLWIWAAWRGSGDRAPSFARAAAFLAIAAALCAPWPFFMRAMSGAAAPIQGNPMLLYTPEFPGYASSRTYGEPLPGFVGYFFAHPLTLAFRWLKDVAGYGVDFVWGLGPIALGLAMAGLLLREPKGRYSGLRPAGILLVAIAVQIAAFSLLERSPRFLVPVVPLACIAVGIAAAPSLDRFCGRRMVALLFVLLIAERAATVGFETRAAARRFPPLPAALTEALRSRASAWAPGALLLTDVPDWAAWHLDRPALLLPTSRTMPRLLREHEVAAILLSPDARRRNDADSDSGWVAVWDRAEMLEGFRGPTPLPGGARLYERAPTRE